MIRTASCGQQWTASGELEKILGMGESGTLVGIPHQGGPACPVVAFSLSGGGNGVMAGNRNSRYSGALNQPINPVISQFVVFKGFEFYIVLQWSKKLDLLMAHYKIEPKEPQCWRELAFHLALDHVPGMRVIDQPGRRKGAPRKRNLSHENAFIELIQTINRARKKGIRDAIRVVQKRQLLKGNVRSLERRYYDSKKRLRRINDRPLPIVHQLAAMNPSLDQIKKDRERALSVLSALLADKEVTLHL
jgi:hypothetical protein